MNVKEAVNLPETDRLTLGEQYRTVRRFSEELCRTLVAEDYVVQSMPDVSPTKWHLAHTSWFFETFLLKPYLPDYKVLDPAYEYLFNSYYNSVGKMFERPHRGLLSRPTVAGTYEYRAHVDRSMLDLIADATADTWEEIVRLVVLGINHEQQHQELMLTDIKHVLAQNPLRPVFRQHHPIPSKPSNRLEWITYEEAIHHIGSDGPGFIFDNEGPRHKELIEPFRLASRLVTNGEYLAFIGDGGYSRSELWLSDGWTAVQEQGWQAPLYWEKEYWRWSLYTLAGMREVDESEPVCHVSYYEADAFARWAGASLPTEAQWEVAAADAPVNGNFAEAGRFQPAPAPSAPEAQSFPQQMFGDVWEWTRSAYAPYPRYHAPPGAVGEYNGKFMCGQFVLRGGSCATSQTHIRRTYRNFFRPYQRWQFMGIRLAKDI